MYTSNGQVVTTTNPNSIQTEILENDKLINKINK
jgi:hypothetical protein